MYKELSISKLLVLMASYLTSMKTGTRVMLSTQLATGEVT